MNVNLCQIVDARYKYITVFYHIFLVFFMLISCLILISCGLTKLSEPLIWNIDNLDKVKKDERLQSTYQDILKNADMYCNIVPFVVTNKKKSFHTDKHYYCSISIYYWPDSLHPGKYVRRDGYKNPELKEYDLYLLSNMSKCLKYLSVAYYLSNNEKYRNAFVKQLKAWFVDKDTYMYPSFRYAQVIPGQNDNRGNGSCLIETYDFNDVIESIRLVNQVKVLDGELIKGLQKWFRTFIMNVGVDYGNYARNVKNNIGLAYDVTLMNEYLFIGNYFKAKKLANNFPNKWLYTHIAADGSQPLEMKRSSGFSYSVYNLSHILDYCFLSQSLMIDNYKKNKELIDKAFNYLDNYANGSEAFKHQPNWDESVSKFKCLKSRRLRLLQPDIYINHRTDKIISINELLQ